MFFVKVYIYIYIYKDEKEKRRKTKKMKTKEENMKSKEKRRKKVDDMKRKKVVGRKIISNKVAWKKEWRLKKKYRKKIKTFSQNKAKHFFKKNEKQKKEK